MFLELIAKVNSLEKKFEKCTSFEEQKGTTYIWENLLEDCLSGKIHTPNASPINFGPLAAGLARDTN